MKLNFSKSFLRSYLAAFCLLFVLLFSACDSAKNDEKERQNAVISYVKFAFSNDVQNAVNMSFAPLPSARDELGVLVANEVQNLGAYAESKEGLKSVSFVKSEQDGDFWRVGVKVEFNNGDSLEEVEIVTAKVNDKWRIWTMK